METPLLQTKLYIPPPRPDAQRVPRPRLIGRLNAGLRRNHGFARKLTLISAPAGFGKTTLVSEWGHVLGSASSPIAVAWLSLDESDDDLARFLTYLIAALQTTDDGIGQGLLSVLQSPGTVNAELILTTLLNEIAALPDSVVLVLDDYHLLESHAIDQAISFTLNHLPSQLHLVIATRSDPNIPLARLRGRGQVNELRAADLRFTAQESGAFLRGIVGADMSPEQIATLNARTEGWAVGLQMAAVSMRGVEDIPAFISTFAGDHRYIVDYLVDEVLAQCSPATREFLLQTSILDRMSAPLCDALSGRSDGQAILEQLEQDNLFTIALDQRRQWYRFHHLFAQLLRHRLLQTYPERVEALHARASHWLDEHGFTHQAITHALALEDKQLAVELIERHATGLLFQGRAQVDSMLDWFKQLPEILPRKHPLLSVFHVWVLVFSSPFKNADQAEQELSLIEQSLDKADVDQATKRTVAGHIASIRAMLAQPPIRTDHDPHAVLALFQKAQNLLPMSETKIRSDLLIGIAYEYMHLEDTKAAHNASKTAFAQARAADNQLVALVSLRNDALVACHQGRIDQAVEILENGITLFDQRHTGKGQYYPGLEILSSALGYMLVECGELERADGELAQGTGLLQWFDEYESIVLLLIAVTRLHLLKGEYESALQFVEQFKPPRARKAALAKTLRIQVELARLGTDAAVPETVVSWMQENQPALDADFQGITPWAETRHLAHLTWIQAQAILNRPGPGPCQAPILQSCLDYLDRRLRAAQDRGLVFRIIECSILKALVLDALGDIDQALAVLSQALALAQPQGFRRVFLDKGQSMRRLLHRLADRKESTDFACQLYTVLQKLQRVETSLSQENLVEPLSPREVQVLQLLSQGLSNREIGERLFLALDTVKGHNRNIYAKLAVKNRTQAINKARSLGILSSE